MMSRTAWTEKTKICRDLLIGRFAAIGEEGVYCYPGKVVEFSGGTVTIQHLDTESGFLRGDLFSEYDICNVADYVFAVDVHDTFLDDEGQVYDFIQHLKLFADDWNNTGFDHNH